MEGPFLLVEVGGWHIRPRMPGGEFHSGKVEVIEIDDVGKPRRTGKAEVAYNLLPQGASPNVVMLAGRLSNGKLGIFASTQLVL